MQPTPTTQHPLALARAQIDDAISPQDWHDLWRTMFDIIKTAPNNRDRINAIRLLCEYRYGKPVALVESNTPPAEARPTTEIPVPSDHPDYPRYHLRTIVDYGDDDDPNEYQDPEIAAAYFAKTKSPAAHPHAHPNAPRQKTITRVLDNVAAYLQGLDRPRRHRPRFQFSRVGITAAL